MGLPWCGFVDANERIHRKVPKLQGDLGKDFVGKDVGRLDKRHRTLGGNLPVYPDFVDTDLYLSWNVCFQCGDLNQVHLGLYSGGLDRCFCSTNRAPQIFASCSVPWLCNNMLFDDSEIQADMVPNNSSVDWKVNPLIACEVRVLQVFFPCVSTFWMKWNIIMSSCHG